MEIFLQNYFLDSLDAACVWGQVPVKFVVRHESRVWLLQLLITGAYSEHCTRDSDSDDNIRAFIQENIVENVNIYSQCFVYQIGFILTSTTSRDQN